MPDAAGPATTLAIIAGRGSLPREIAERRAEAGLPYLLIVYQGCFESWMAAHPHQHHEFERVGAMFRALRAADVTHVVFAGGMNRPRVRFHRVDLKGVTVAAKALTLLRRGDDAMLRGFSAIFESEGITLIGPQEILGQGMTVAPGPLTTAEPAADDRRDAARAAEIVAALGPLDVGQGAVVARGVCLAVEAVEGTDLMLMRVAKLPPERRASAAPPSGVLFKGPKPDQDHRLDMPAIGPATLEAAAAAGLNGIVVAADRTVLIEADATREAARQSGLFVYGVTPEQLADWQAATGD
ncbi:MAG: UDP-2,3-diacylglucosamine diphosphatase LpxI [Pseudomonadota bacterium]